MTAKRRQGAKELVDGLRIIEILGRDRSSATFRVADSSGRERVARELVVGAGLRRHLRWAFEVHRSLRISGLVVPDALHEDGERVVWVHRPAAGEPLSHGELSPAAALRFATSVVALVGELHARSLIGFELRPERLFVGADDGAISTGLLAAPGLWDATSGVESLKLLQIDERVDLAALGDVLAALCNHTRRAADDRGRAVVAGLGRLAAALSSDEPPTLDDVIGKLAELGGPVVALAPSRPVRSARLVGREQLLGELETLIEGVLASGPEESRPRLAAVAGRAGIGKTRAVIELVARSRELGYRVYATRARASDQRLLGPLEDIVGELEERPSGPPADVDAALSPAAERRRLIEKSVGNLLAALAGKPTTLVVEDIDLLPAGGLEALSYLVRELSLAATDPVPVFVVVTLRPAIGAELDSEAGPLIEDLREDGFAERIRLPPLSVEDVQEMLTSMGLGGRMDARRLARRARGNPRHVEEIARLEQEHRGESTRLTLDEIVRRRVRRSTEAERQVLEAAAILERAASLDLLAELVPARHRPKLYRTVMSLVARRLFAPSAGPEFGFASRETAHAIRRKLAVRRRKQLHRLAGRALAATGAGAAVLAEHFEAGGPREAFVEHGLVAAAELEEAHATEQALDLYSRLLVAVPRRRARVYGRILERCAALRAMVGDFEGAADAYGELIASTPEGARTWQHYKALGRACRGKQDHVAAAAAFDKGLGCLGEGEELAVADLLSEKAYMLTMVGDVDTARGLADMADTIAGTLDQSREVAEIRNRLYGTFRRLGDSEGATAQLELCLRISEKVGALDLASAVLNNLGLYLSDLGERQRGLEYLQRGLEIAEKLGDLQSTAVKSANLACVLLRESDHEAARTHLDRGLTIARRFGRSSVVANCLEAQAELDFQRAHYGDAMAGRLRVLRMSERLGDSSAHANQLFGLARDYVALGHGERADRAASELLQIARRRNDRRLEALAMCCQSAARKLVGEYERASGLLASAEAELRDLGFQEELVACLLEHADLDVRRGDHEAAGEVAREAVAIAADHDYHAERALALLILAEVTIATDLSRAERYLREAEGIAGVIDQPEIRWRCEYLAGEIVLRKGDATGAARRFALARAILDEIVAGIPDADLSYCYVRDPRRVALLRRARENREEEEP